MMWQNGWYEISHTTLIHISFIFNSSPVHNCYELWNSVGTYLTKKTWISSKINFIGSNANWIKVSKQFFPQGLVLHTWNCMYFQIFYNQSKIEYLKKFWHILFPFQNRIKTKLTFKANIVNNKYQKWFVITIRYHNVFVAMMIQNSDLSSIIRSKMTVFKHERMLTTRSSKISIEIVGCPRISIFMPVVTNSSKIIILFFLFWVW